MKTLYKVNTILILALGLLHISLTPMFFPSLTSGALWFAGGGIMILFLSFLNFILMSGGSKQRVATVLTHTANLTGLVFACAILLIESRRKTPGPSTWVVLALLVFETVAAFLYAGRSRA
jgi:hypothetical protein